MTKTLSLPSHGAVMAAAFALFFLASFGVSASTAHAASAISRQMSLGSSGASVTQLQTLLATSPTLYPAALVTGYYGPMTETAVAQFQIANNLPPVGNVGPQTLAKLNQLIANNVTVLDATAPFVSNVNVSTNSTNATITWNTSEMAFGKVHYDVSPIVMYENNAAMVEPQTSGTVITETGQTAAHAITLSGLNHGQTYFFSVESSDATGNLSVSLPNSFYVQ